MTVFDEEAFVEAFEDDIEEIDHLGGKVDELIVKFSVVFFDMYALHFKYDFFHEFQLVKLSHVDFFTLVHSVIGSPDNFKVEDKVFQSAPYMFSADIGPIEEAIVITCERVCFLDVLRSA